MKKSRISKVIVTYSGYPNLTASFKSIKCAHLYCESIYEQFGIHMLHKEMICVLRNY